MPWNCLGSTALPRQIQGSGGECVQKQFVFICRQRKALLKLATECLGSALALPLSQGKSKAMVKNDPYAVALRDLRRGLGDGKGRGGKDADAEWLAARW